MKGTMKYSADIPAGFVDALLRMSDEIKLRIISLLTDSLLKSEQNVADEEAYTRKMLEKHAGTWVGDETTDEIMGKIRESSSIREPLKF